MIPGGPPAGARRAAAPHLHGLRSATRRLRERHLPLRPAQRLGALAALAMAITISGGLLVYVLEAGAPGAQIHTLGDGLWWAIVTMSTVGYGDTVPHTPAGRLVGAGLMLSGIGLAALGLATLISVLVAEDLADRRRAARHIRRRFRDLRRNQFAAATLVALLFLLLGGLLAWIFESSTPNSQVQTYGDGLWWAIVTMATVGYGDVVPHTGGGRLVAVGLMLGGITTVSLMTASIASGLVAENLKEARGLEAISGGGHILLCGWNQHAERVIEGLAGGLGGSAFHLVLVNQLPEEAVTDILYKYRDLGLRYIRGSHANEAVLERANVRTARAAVVLADMTAGVGAKVDETTVLAALALKHLNPDLRVTGEVLDEQNAVHLRRAAAGEVVISGEHNAFLLTASVAAPGLAQAVRELLGGGSGRELRRMPLAAPWAGRPFGELAAHLRQRQGLLLLGLITERRGITLDEMLGSDSSFIDDFIRRKFADAGMVGRVWDAGGLAVTVNPDDAHLIGPHDAAIVVGRAAEDRL